jgi:hypothetical protein
MGRAAYVSIADGRPRTVSFAYTSDGQILKREEKSTASANPLDYHYFVSGVQIGDLTNNGNGDHNEVDYVQYQYQEENWNNNQQAAPFAYNTTGGVTDGDFGGGGYDFINPANNGSQLTGSSYTVQGGDTLPETSTIWGIVRFRHGDRTAGLG